MEEDLAFFSSLHSNNEILPRRSPTNRNFATINNKIANVEEKSKNEDPRP
jgi:hypothetical protein